MALRLEAIAGMAFLATEGVKPAAEVPLASYLYTGRLSKL